MNLKVVVSIIKYLPFEGYPQLRQNYLNNKLFEV